MSAPLLWIPTEPVRFILADGRTIDVVKPEDVQRLPIDVAFEPMAERDDDGLQVYIELPAFVKGES